MADVEMMMQSIFSKNLVFFGFSLFWTIGASLNEESPKLRVEAFRLNFMILRKIHPDELRSFSEIKCEFADKIYVRLHPTRSTSYGIQIKWN